MNAHAPLGARFDAVTQRFRDVTALDSATFEIPPGAITGLLGRNGSGKTTAMSLLASLRRPTSGRVTVDGRDPFEDESLMERVCLVRESGDLLTAGTVRGALAYARMARPTWDHGLADELLDAFGIDPGTRVTTLSRGARSAVAATVGLASRAPLTILDEVYLGMDAPTRVLFYERLLADYAEHPRTIVLSSHLIDEVERLIEHAVVLDAGRVALAGTVEELTGQGATVTGAADRVDAAVEGLTVLAERNLGATKEVAVHGVLDRPALALRDAGLEVGRLGLQELVIHVTGRTP